MTSPYGDSALDAVLVADPPPFALLHRPEASGRHQLDLLLGHPVPTGSLAEVPVGPATATGRARYDTLVLLPFRQIAERGFAVVDDGAPLLSMVVDSHTAVPVEEALARIADLPLQVAEGAFDVDDDAYARIVREIIGNEIGRGAGANFVIKRSFLTEIADYTPAAALTVFRRLLELESGAYWTFLIHTGERTFVGATPERHLSLSGGTAVMNPISGTYRYPASGPTLDGLAAFLADTKEADELYMVVDEELKMMARICERGGRLLGPQLREMAHLAHTEYFIEGTTDRDVREILRESLFAPTVTGSPLESACGVISTYEPAGRGYYSGVVALLGRDADGPTLDSAILIRTAEIDRTGRVSVPVGATLVRHSDPASEVAETRAKAAGVLAAMLHGPGRSRGGAAPGLAAHPQVLRALESRNQTLSSFWTDKFEDRAQPLPGPAGRRALVVDAEDTFTAMLALQLSALGLDVEVRRFDDPGTEPTGYDLVVLGPGPGDPRAADHPKIAYLRSAVRRLLDDGTPFMAVCLSHQVLSDALGFRLAPREVPNQGVQKRIPLFGRDELVGFYNTFAARSDEDRAPLPALAARTGEVEISRDPATGEIHALRGPGFCSMQFHAESVLTADGPRIIGDLLGPLLAGR
ncbi:anthranilate synthase family protein [Kitasatospora sp. NPDC052868]|uniref:anthranilate synthase family protein n=1 Tax=Kitasatospora sp. NPDC052868 TaxID=3364060 RepID=UPI0037C57C7E